MSTNDVLRGLIKLLNEAPQTRVSFPDNEFPCESKELESYIKEHNIEGCRVDGHYVNDTILLGMEAYSAISSIARIGIAIYSLRMPKRTLSTSYIATFYPCNCIRSGANLEFTEVFKTESDPRFAIWYKDKSDYNRHTIEQAIRKRFPAAGNTKGDVFKLIVDCNAKIKYTTNTATKSSKLTVKYDNIAIKVSNPTYEDLVKTGVLDVKF